MSDLNWGVPSQRKTKVEKFDTPVLTMSKLEGKGSGRKFSFNKAAIEALGIDSETEQTAMVGFGKDNSIFIKVVNGEEKVGYRLTKTGTFSNKKVFEHITKLKELSNDVENEFHLGDSEVDEAMEVVSITNDGETTSSEDVVSETISESDIKDSDSVTEDAEVLDESTDESTNEPDGFKKEEKTTKEVEEEEW